MTRKRERPRRARARKAGARQQPRRDDGPQRASSLPPSTFSAHDPRLEARLAASAGTLLQLLFPIAFVAHFAWRHLWYAAAVCAWWVAQNGWDVAIYVADARAESLPLVGGGEHDWAWLLVEWNALGADHAIARSVHHLSTLVAIGALVAALLMAGRRAQDEE